MELTPIFVYGTLMSGRRNRRLLESAVTRCQPATTIGWLFELRGRGYPALVLEPGVLPARFGAPARVHGELCWTRATERLWQTLDQLEGYRPGDPDSLYIRVETAVTLDDETHTAHTYVWNPSRIEELIDQSDWLRAGRF